MKTFSLLLCFLLLAVVAPTVSAREKRIVDQFRSLAGRVADFVWNDPVRYWSQKIGDLFKDDTPGWRNGYFYRIPDGLKNLTLADYYRMNNAKPTTREELRRHAEQGLVLLQDDEPEAGDPLPEKYHFFDQYPQCLKEEWNQNTCGSCWAFAAATSMTHRLCKAIVDAGYHPPGRDEEDRLSPQQILSCNPYDSGCKGGQTYHAHLVIAQQYIQPVHCSPYLSWDGQRHPEDCPKMRETCAAMGRGKKGSGWGGRRDRRAAIRVTGATPKIIFGEEALMRAIHTGGPVTVTMKTPARFIGASGKGVFKRGPDGPWLEKKEPGAAVLHSWHAVSISGWGVENGEKYWILENSWGGVYDSKIPNHNKGFLKVLRGANDMLIETNMNIVQDPLIWNDKNERVSVKDGWWRPDQGKFDAELGIRSRKFADEQSNDNDRAREAIDREAARVIEEAKEYLAEKSA